MGGIIEAEKKQKQAETLLQLRQQADFQRRGKRLRTKAASELLDNDEDDSPTLPPPKDKDGDEGSSSSRPSQSSTMTAQTKPGNLFSTPSSTFHHFSPKHVPGTKSAKMIKGLTSNIAKNFKSRMLGRSKSGDAKPFYAKDAAVIEELQDVLKGSESAKKLFGHINESVLQDLINAFQEREAKQGETLIKQGTHGDCMYIVSSGHVDFYVARPGFDGTLPVGRGDFVDTMGPGALFGEHAVIYEAN